MIFFASLFSSVHLLEAISCLSDEIQLWKGFIPKNAIRKSQKLLPLVKMVEKHGGLPIHLRCMLVEKTKICRHICSLIRAFL